MVMMIEPLDLCIRQLKERDYDAVIYMTPDGNPRPTHRQPMLALPKHHFIVWSLQRRGPAGPRPFDHREISIGDFVLSGGELAAAVFCDEHIIRLIPGVLGDESSALSDSFQDGLFAPPIYTRPANYNGWEVRKSLPRAIPPLWTAGAKNKPAYPTPPP